ncbi:MAG: efflux RND transporter periplasmic adaptor subunit [Burkholderiales bacterium]|nr:efflux RND transporter periplasmic adaptor subunit [Burkholderiales bacterium]
MTDRRSPAPSAIAETLQLGASVSTLRRQWRWFAAAAALIVIVVVSFAVLRSGNDQVRYQTAKVERGNLIVIVTATGTLQPTNQVDVGSELSGIVKSVGVDYNDMVKVGQVLARLDTTKLEAQVLQSGAALKAAAARVREAEASENEMRRKLARAKELFDQKFISEEALVTAQAAADRAVATLQSARSQAEQAQATLEVDRTNLAKSVIRSPINGIVLSRKVEPGQTVAATLQTPVLFTLAEDLTKMELHVDVDEADIGEVQRGQSATFTVSAYPGRDFPSRVTDVRNAAKTVSGVVTYETVLAVDNADLALRPGMTGTANITVNRLNDVLLVPNAALRFVPPAPATQEKRSFVSRLLPIPPHRTPEVGKAGSDRRHQQVWSLEDGKPVAIAVTVGASDGRRTEIVAGNVKPGLEVLTDVLQAAK